MRQNFTKPCFGIRHILIALLTLIPLFHASAADGDEFEVDGIKYTVISEAEKTCKTKEGYTTSSGFSWSGTSTLTYHRGNLLTGEVTLPSNPNGYSLIEIGKLAFWNCPSLTSITIPSTVVKIGDSAFKECDALTDVTIPDSVTEIGSAAFMSCYSLKSIIVPASVNKLGSYAFSNCTLTPIILKGDYKSAWNVLKSDLNSTSIILCNSTSISRLKDALGSIWSNKIFAYDTPYNLATKASYTGCTSTVSENPYCLLKEWSDYKIKFDKVSYNDKEEKIAETFFTLSDVEPGEYNISGVPMGTNVEATVSWKADGENYSDTFSLTTTYSNLISGIKSTSAPTSITIDQINYTNDSTLNISEVGVYFNDQKYPFKDKIVFDDLEISKYYNMTPYLLYNDGKDEFKGDEKSILTQLPDFNINYSATQTSVTITGITVSPSENIKIAKKGVKYNSTYYELKDKIVIDDLCPDYNYYMEFYIVYGNDGKYKKESWEGVTTNGWNKNVSIATKGPTSVELKATFKNNQIEPTECWWEVGGEKYPGKDVVVTGLTPQAKYTPVLKWTYESPKKEMKQYTQNTFPKDVTLPALTLNTLAPRGVSATCAIVAAETNIQDVEPMVGFQWKKYDAPSTLAPNEGFGAVCDGVVEGYIKNLQSAFYYNVRAFYKSAEGKYYYGDWVTFDPSDFSFFEPTVRTYPVQEVGANSAMVRGYALAGTENIKSQGFQYWLTSGPSSARMYAPANTEVYTIVASGQIMTATFEDLLPGTSYTYRAFVETEAGFTFGDEQKFTTSESPTSGVMELETEETAPVIIGYFDLTGRRYNVMQPGMNIIVYSDGSTRKVMNR